MATTVLSFGTGNTLLGLETAPTSTSPDTGYRASFQALPTVSYAGTAAASTYTVTLSLLNWGFSGSNHGIGYLTTLAGGSAHDGSNNTLSAGSSFTTGTVVTFTTSTTSSLISFLKGLYLGDTQVITSTDHFKLTMTVSDGTTSAATNTIFYNVACYLRGTGVTTEHGEVAVEDLRIGDKLRTLDGSLKPIKFIGTQMFEPEFIAATPSQRPVLIRQGAMGANLPARDLYLSPMHSVYVDEVMVPAVALENGVSILRADVPGNVEYFHLELDTHEVILAEGLPAESFIDDESRAVFDNAYEYEMLYGEGERIQPCAPRIEEGYQVEAIRRRFAEMAGVAQAEAAQPARLVGHVERIEDGVLEGWVMDQANGGAVELEVLVDGETVGRTLANRYRTDLDHAGLAGGRCGFTMALPASASSLEQVQVRTVATGAELRKARAAATA